MNNGQNLTISNFNRLLFSIANLNSAVTVIEIKIKEGNECFPRLNCIAIRYIINNLKWEPHQPKFVTATASRNITINELAVGTTANDATSGQDSDCSQGEGGIWMPFFESAPLHPSRGDSEFETRSLNVIYPAGVDSLGLLVSGDFSHTTESW